MKNNIFLFVLLLLVSAGSVGTLRAADPYVGYLYPAGVQAGTTNCLIVGGQYFWRMNGGFVSGGGVDILSITPVPNFAPPTGDQRRYLVKWLDAIADGHRERPPLPNIPHLDEWRSNTWWSVLGDLDARQLSIVEHDLYTPRNALQMSPSLRQMLLVTVAVRADAAPGARDFVLFNLQGASPPRPLIVTAAPHVQEPLFTPPHRKTPPLPPQTTFPCVLDGQIMPGSTDTFVLRLTKGEPISLTVFGREFQPYVGDAVPGFFNPVLRIVAPDGTEAAFADDWYHRPDPFLVFTPPADGDYTLEIRDNLYRGREDFVYMVTIDSGTKPSAFASPTGLFAPLTYPNDVVRDGKIYSGVLEEPSDSETYRFDVSEPGYLTFDLLARRMGSPLDARLTLRDDDDNVLAVLDDATNTVFAGTVIQAECDPVGSVHFAAAGRYNVTVEDATGHGGPDYAYTLRIGVPTPNVRIFAERASFVGVSWKRIPVSFSVLRSGGFTGSIRLNDTKWFTWSNPVIPAESNRVTAVLVFRGDLRPGPPIPLELSATAVLDGVSRDIRVIPSDSYNQAFAWDHLVPARSFMMKIWPTPKRVLRGRPEKNQGRNRPRKEKRK